MVIAILVTTFYGSHPYARYITIVILIIMAPGNVVTA